jgi:competence protein ComEC
MPKILASVLLILIWLFFSSSGATDKLVVYFLDIGQGDATLIRTPGGQNILIDGGPDNNLLGQLGEVLPWWERKIDYVIISHYHDDHFLGLMELLKKYKVTNILVTAQQPPDFNYQVWLDVLKQHHLQPTIVKLGEKFVLNNDLSWQVLAADDDHKDYNENSLVLRLSYKNIDFLMMGDLPIGGEEKLLNNNFGLESEILKVGHHGSKYSSGEDFLSVVKPRICVIESGLDNKFGHPHQETLQRLEKVGCQIRNTQIDGQISILTDGFSYQVSR